MRTVASLISGISEHKIRIVSPDIGGGFGNKVGVYPGYICSIVASIVHRRAGEVDRGPDRKSHGHRLRPRLPHDRRDRGARKDGRITALKCHVIADHGAFDACADPTKFRPASSTSAPAPTTSRPPFLSVDGVYTNKAPGGVAYRCSFRVTEAAYFIERMMDVLARKLNMDPAEGAAEELHPQATSSPTSRRSAGNMTAAITDTAFDKALDSGRLQGPARRAEKNREDFAAGKTRSLMGIGVAFFTEIVGAGPIEELRHPGPRHVRPLRDPHPPDGQSPSPAWARSARARAMPRPSPRSCATEIGLPADDITVEEGDTDTAPYGLGTYGSRSTPVAGAATAMAGAEDPRQGADDRRLSARSA